MTGNETFSDLYQAMQLIMNKSVDFGDVSLLRIGDFLHQLYNKEFL